MRLDEVSLDLINPGPIIPRNRDLFIRWHERDAAAVHHWQIPLRASMKRKQTDDIGGVSGADLEMLCSRIVQELGSEHNRMIDPIWQIDQQRRHIYLALLVIKPIRIVDWI